MSSFKIGTKEWLLTLDAPTIRTIREEVGVDLVDDGKGYGIVLQDVCILVDVLWLLCRDQAKVNNPPIDELGFKKSISGQCLTKGEEALLEAIVDFSPRKREVLQSLVETNAKVQEAGKKKAIAKIKDPCLAERIDAALEEGMEAEVQKMLTQLRSATSTPAGAV